MQRRQPSGNNAAAATSHTVDSSEQLTVDIDITQSQHAVDVDPHPRQRQGSHSSTTSSSHGGVGWRPLDALLIGGVPSTPVLLGDSSANEEHNNNTGGIAVPQPAAQRERRLSSGDALYQDAPQPPVRVQGSPHTFQCPVAPTILRHIDPGYRTIDEFRSVYYTPITCQPEELALPENGYTLRPVQMKRPTELLIAVTMYNESEEFLMRTLGAVFRNVRMFCEMNNGTMGDGAGGLAPGHAGPRGSTAAGTPHLVNGRPSSTIGMTPLAQVHVDRVGTITFVSANNQPPTAPGKPSHLAASSNSAYQPGASNTDHLWTAHGWQRIVVCIIADGRSKVHPRVLHMLQAMGVYQEQVRMDEVLDPMEEKPVCARATTAHLYEYTCQCVVDGERELRGGTRQGVVPVQLMFLLKEKNAKKLNSHKWLFRGIAPILNPNICVLIDVGTRPATPDAIYRLWRAFDRNHHIAGACGEICVMTGKGCGRVRSVVQPLVAAQNFEYKVSNVLDKPLESSFGYISVLPGAFSAYRWEALQDINADEGPLVSYFKGEIPVTAEAPKGNVFTSNMYLAEDRILCFELVAKRNSRWRLHYVANSKAETDVPSTLPEFISQRRRWLNGTFFCQIYAITHMPRFWRTRHSAGRKVALTVQFLYLLVTNVFGWFAMGNFYLSFYLLSVEALGANASWADGLLFEVMRYMGIIVAQFICSLGNRPQGSSRIYTGSAILFSIIMLFLLAMSFMLIANSWPQSGTGTDWLVNGGTGRDVVLATVSTFGVYAAASLMAGEFVQVMSCLVQYLLMLPFFINTLAIYAFCNSHDVSWGTKGDNNKPTASDSGKARSTLVMTDPTLTAHGKSTVHPPTLAWTTLTEAHALAMADLRQNRDSSDTDAAPSRPDATTRREDYYKNFRTALVLSWALSNGLLVAVLSSDRVAPFVIGTYMRFLMYAVAVFALVRLLGAVWFKSRWVVRQY